MYFFDKIRNDVITHLRLCRLPVKYICNITEDSIDNLAFTIYSDVIAYAQKDPAKHGSVDIVYHNTMSFKAVFYYRIANFLYYLDEDRTYPTQLKAIAEDFSNIGKRLSHIEINPAAKIGHSFVIDHGDGVVIGETAEIGNNCYLLQGVILGAKGIANNPKEKRHPTIGNDVEIGAFVRVLGNINIGDNVKISPHAIITDDVPSNSKVTIVNQYQTLKYEQSIMSEISALVPDRNGWLVFGKHLSYSVSCYFLANEKVYDIESEVLNDNIMLLQYPVIKKEEKISQSAILFKQNDYLISAILGVNSRLLPN
jgi:serine O-acetyltransferase